MKSSNLFSDSPRCHAPRRGSALLLTLMVVSLLMVLVLSFVVFVRMELRQVVNHQNLLQARANARLGMDLALNQLQLGAGPDTRVTGAVEQTPSTPPNHAWLYRGVHSEPVIQQTGGTYVPNPLFGQTVEHFLSTASDSEFDSSGYWPYLGDETLEDGHALMVGLGSVTEEDEDGDGVPDGIVAAPMRDIEMGTDGSFAFWTQDQGTLARMNLTEPATNAAGQTLTDREKAVTAQRVGSEGLIDAYDPSNAAHNLDMQRLESESQLDLTPFAEDDTARELFHHITLRGAGLPVNVTRGGFKRDLTAVMREMENSSGRTEDGGDQWEALKAYQSNRIGFWRDLTTDLPASPPSDWMADAPEWKRLAQWNALTALTLRDDQADTNAYEEKIFPPNSDIDTRWDPGGPHWEQLLGYGTLMQHQGDGGGRLVARSPDGRAMTVNPVVAKFSLSYYFTLDWPTLRIHFIPAVVVWNPYNKPLRPEPGEEWQYIWAYESQRYPGYGVSFQVSHRNWRGGDKLWTPIYRLPWQYSNNNGQFLFRLVSNDPSSPVVIPPGEAVFFTMNEHVQVVQDIEDNPQLDKFQWTDEFVDRVPENTVIDLFQGMHGDGGYGFYMEHDDMDDRIRNLVAKGPRRDPERWNRNNSWNSWDSKGFPFAVYRQLNEDTGMIEDVDGSLPPKGGPTHGSEYPVNYAQNRVHGANRSIGVNESGLNGWDFHAATAVVWGGQGGSEFRPRGNRLGSVTAGSAGTGLRGGDGLSNTLNGMRFLYLKTPSVLEDARPEDFDDPGTPNVLPLFTSGFPSFDDSPPFDDVDPQFPAWGHVWGLRMPDSSFTYSQTAEGGDEFTQSAHFGAPARWLVDYNPLSPHVTPDPVGRLKDRRYRGSYQNPGSIIGGFTVDPSAFKLPQFNPEDTDNQYIGWSDDLAPVGSLGSGWIPRFPLVEVPESPEDIASLAAFSHARFNPDIDFAHRKVQTVYTANSPVYAVGNSIAPVLVPRDRAVQSYYPPPDAGDHRGMVERVGVDDASRQAGAQGRERRLVGDEPRGEHQCRGLPVEIREHRL